jgi:hypothetical protein
MNYKTLANGDLLLTASNSDRAELARIIRDADYGSEESFIAECYHERLYFIRPEAVGALTDAPILCDDMSWPDDGDIVPRDTANVWWFPDYMIRDPWAELARFGRVRFTKAESVR